MEPTKLELKWRELLANQEQSGLSVAEWARSEGLDPQDAYRWRSQIRARDQRRREEQVDQPVPGWLQVRVVDGGASPRPTLRVRLVGGREIEVDEGFDEEHLARLVLVLESLPC